MTKERKRLIYSMFFPAVLILLMWLVKLFEYSFNFSASEYGILPRRLSGLIGIMSSPFIHSNSAHLLSNTFPFFILGTALFYFFGDYSFKVLIWLLVGTGIWVWIAGRPAYHIGASGLVYGLASFLVFSGFLSKNRALTALSLTIVFLYGGMIWGILPVKEGISWESHLFGGLTGLFLALWFTRKFHSTDETRGLKKQIWEYDFSPPKCSSDNISQIRYDFKENNHKPEH